MWPDRGTLRATMPECFRASFGTKVAVIIDCFEVFIERPSNLQARASTRSSYKHHNTIKVSIRYCTTRSCNVRVRTMGRAGVSVTNILQNDVEYNLLPGDVVLADQGLDITDSVGMMQATLHIPAFTKGKDQLSAVEVDETRTIEYMRSESSEMSDSYFAKHIAC